VAFQAIGMPRNFEVGLVDHETQEQYSTNDTMRSVRHLASTSANNVLASTVDVVNSSAIKYHGMKDGVDEVHVLAM